MKRSNPGLSAIEMFIIGMVVLFSYAVAVADYVERVTYYPISSNLNNSGQQWGADSAYAALYADSILAYYPFDSDSTTDFSGNHSVTTKGGSGLGLHSDADTAETGGGAIRLTYSASVDSGYLVLTDVLTNITSTVNGHIGAWYRPNAVTDSVALLSFGDTNANEVIAFYLTRIGDIKAICIDGGTVAWSCSTSTHSVTDSTWNYIAFSHDGDSIGVNVNGDSEVLVFSATAAKGSWFEECAGIDNAYLGCTSYNSNSLLRLYDGFVDELIIEKDTWTASAISAYYLSPGTYNTDYAGQIDNVSGYLYFTQFNPGYEAARRALTIQDVYGYFVAGFRATDTTGAPPNIRWIVQAKDTTDGNVWTDISDTGYSHATTIDQADYGDIDTLKGYIATSTLEYVPAQFRMFFISDSANVSLAKWENKTYLDFRFKTTE